MENPVEIPAFPEVEIDDLIIEQARIIRLLQGKMTDAINADDLDLYSAINRELEKAVNCWDTLRTARVVDCQIENQLTVLSGENRD